MKKKLNVFYVEIRESDGDVGLFKIKANDIEDATKKAGLLKPNNTWIRSVYDAKNVVKWWPGFVESAPYLENDSTLK